MKNKSIEQILDAVEKGRTIQIKTPIVETEPYFRKIIVFASEPKEYLLSRFEFELYKVERRKLE